jgi:xanthine/CO dehydrogenase XdhC/CoxF family maturation factor
MTIHYKIDIAKTAEALGVTPQYVYMILGGKRKGKKFRKQLGLENSNKSKGKKAA